ncbi:MAG: tRNA pseudouridine(55) synthase TruB [Bacteroidales bacterium]|nr:tRNA pseudouridine(55) synthase TruB [Bacteroidales bacterium]
MTPFTRDIADYPGGIVLPVDKPFRWTSADVIRKLKFAAIKHFGKKNLKVGHAGTLDPLATGVLLVCIGDACKRAQQLQDSPKEYVARIRFGATTPSYDLEKDIDRTFPYEHITAEAVAEALKGFIGVQEQVAPLFSAKSVDGVRAYELARKLYRRGETDKIDELSLSMLQRNTIEITELELLSFTDFSTPPPAPLEMTTGTASNRINVADTSALGLPEATIRIACSKGTYIRAFARDLGEALSSGAHLSALQRSRSGSYRIDDCLSLDDALSSLSR